MLLKILQSVGLGLVRSLVMGLQDDLLREEARQVPGCGYSGEDPYEAEYSGRWIEQQASQEERRRAEFEASQAKSQDFIEYPEFS